MADFVTIFTFS